MIHFCNSCQKTASFLLASKPRSISSRELQSALELRLAFTLEAEDTIHTIRA
jgi:hypothetical protein